MPIYQYNCGGCRQQVEIFFRSVTAASKPTCPQCGSKKLKRRISRVARVRSESERLSSIDLDQELGKLDGKSEADFARWTRRMGEELGDELGADFRELADRTDAGDDPVERVDPSFTLRNRVERRKEQLAGDSTDSGVE